MLEDEVIDAKIAAAEARTDSKFAELRLANAEVNAKLDRVLSAVQATDNRVAKLEDAFAQHRVDIDRRFSDQRAEIDKRFAGQGLDIDKRFSDIDKRFADQRSEFKADFRAGRALTMGAALSLAGLMIVFMVAIFGVGGTMFSRGIQIRDVIKAVIAEQQQSQSTPQKP